MEEKQKREKKLVLAGHIATVIQFVSIIRCSIEIATNAINMYQICLVCIFLSYNSNLVFIISHGSGVYAFTNIAFFY